MSKEPGPGPPGLASLARLYRTLLVLYPASWRREDRNDLVAFFEESCRRGWTEGRWAGAARAIVAGYGDAIRAGLAERVGERLDSGRTHGNEESSMGEVVEGILRDVRMAFRSLLRSPGFTVVCVLTLALGIGPNTALFTVLRGLVFAPLPYPEAEQLVAIRRDLVVRGIPNYPAAPADLIDYREHTDAFQAIAGYFAVTPILTDGDRTERLTGLRATPELFEVLGVVPALGRAFTKEEGIAGAEDGGQAPGSPVVLSHRFWERRFASDPNVIGRTLAFGGATAEVVGVMPQDFRLTLSPDDAVPSVPDVILPFTIDPTDPFRGSFFMRTIGRLAPGASLGAAAAQIEAASAWQRTQYPSAQAAGTTARLAPLQDDVGAGVRPLLLRLGGAVGFVLLIACVNVANLLLVRSAGRGRELSVRRALGGGRGRLVRQLLAESTLLALLGGAMGVALAWATLPLLARALPPDLPRIEALELSLPVLAFTLGAVVLSALLFGVLPALRGSRADVMDALRGRSGTTGASARVRSGLVVVEVALSFMLVVGAGLMVRSFLALQQVDPGFQADGVLVFQATLPPGAYASSEERVSVAERLRAELSALPDAEAVGAANAVPLGGGGGPQAPYGGEAELADGDESDLRQANVRIVGEGYFEALQTPLLAGRALTATDATDDVVKVLVDESTAERTWPGESAIGKQIYVKVVMPGIWFEVAGVVGHQRHQGLTGDSRGTIYFPAGSLGGPPSTWTVRTAGDPVALVPSVRAAVARVDDRILVENVEPLADRVDRALSPTRLVSTLLGSFGLLALLLALVGLYGVVAYMVRARSGEFGLRMALGAERGGILRMVLGRGLLLSGVGITVGLVCTLGLTRVIGGFVVGVAPSDPLTLGAVAVLFLVMAAAATLIPAYRAVRVDPATTLREE